MSTSRPTTNPHSGGDTAARVLHWVDCQPAAIAVRLASGSLTYGELGRRARCLERRIHELSATASGVAVITNDERQLLTTLLAAALVRVPATVLSPSMWKTDLMRAVTGRIVLCDRHLAASLPQATCIALDVSGADAAADDEPARPPWQPEAIVAHAGAEVLSHALLADFEGALREFDLPRDHLACVAESTSVSFVLTAWTALANGGTLCILPPTSHLGVALRTASRTDGPLTLVTPSSVVNGLLEEDPAALSYTSGLLLLDCDLEPRHQRELSQYALQRSALLALSVHGSAPAFIGRIAPAAEAQLLTALGKTLHGAALSVPHPAIDAAAWTDVSIQFAGGTPLPAGVAGRRHAAGWEICVSAAALPDEVTEEAWTETECRVAEICAQILQRDYVDPRADFIAMGGNSLLAMRLVAQVNSEFDRDIPWALFLRKPKLAELAAAIDDSAPAELDDLRPSPRRNCLRLLAELDRFDDVQLEALLKEVV